ncbi:hypothetical protein ACEPAF_5124 [Sanghuangporus sanghuang]
MSDKKRACAVLKIASETCTAALKALRDPTTTVQIPEHDAEVSLHTRLTDYVSLLSLLYQNSTKLAIALKPSNLAYSAAIVVAKNLATQADALASCAWSINDVVHGRTLAREIRWTAEDVLSALTSLLEVYTSDAHGQGSGEASEAGDPYLFRTGVVHDAIDRGRGISRTNREAVKKRWDGVVGGMSDCEKEAQEMVEEEERDCDNEEGGHANPADSYEDDEWEQFSGASRGNTRASPEELARLRIVHTSFKFIHALVERVDLIFLRPSSRVTPPPKTLDKLLSSAEMLLQASDDLVHALYIPQTPAAVASKSKNLMVLVDEIRSEVLPVGLVTDGQGDNDAITNLSQQTTALDLDSRHNELTMTKERKWFDTCFGQIFKTAANLA